MIAVCALVHQVSIAAGLDPEWQVTTWISRPLWIVWCAEMELPVGTEPRNWRDVGGQTCCIYGSHTCCIYGSHTVVVDQPGLWAISRHQ